MKLFEFGEYWDTSTFVFFIFVGVLIAFLCNKGASKDFRLDEIHKYRRVNIYYCFAFILLVCINTFKDISFGADTQYYVYAFLDSTSFVFNLRSSWEPLFVLLNFLIRSITKSYTIYFFLVSLIIAYGYIRFIRTFWKKDCDFLFLILAAISFNYDMNIMRSAIGGSFLLLSLCALNEKKIKKSLLLSVVATLFQYTIIVNLGFIIFYLLVKKRRNVSSKRLLFWSIAGFVVMFVVAYVFMGTMLESRYSHYITESTPTLIGNWEILLSGLLSFIVLSRKMVDNSRIDVAELSAVFSIILLIPCFILGAYRLTIYYFMPRLVLWGYFSKRFFANDKQTVFLKRILVICAVVFYALFTMSRRSGNPGFKYMIVDIW